MPLELPVEDRCSFCAYLAGERPYTVLERTDLAALLVTREQLGIGHVLAIPVEHRVSLLDLTTREASAVMHATIRGARAIEAAFDPGGIAVWQNNGVLAQQSIPHVHFHIAGTLPGGGTKPASDRRLTTEETDAIAHRLRPHLSEKELVLPPR